MKQPALKSRLSRIKKAGDLQAKRRADDLAEQLGYLIVRERTEGADVAAESQRLVDEIVVLQKEIAASGGDTDAPSGESAEGAGE